MKLSIVIICWNDWKLIQDCLKSIFDGTRRINFEVIVSDNGSTDGSVENIRAAFPKTRVVENRANLGFARGNNAGIQETTGDYVLILNPDTIVLDGALDRWMDYVQTKPEAGAFGCRILNPDRSYQRSARPFPTPGRYLIAALWLHFLGYIWEGICSNEYVAWKGDTEREIDWQSGCCVMFRGDILRQLGGFDAQFFYHFEESDLCNRVHKAGFPIWYTPTVEIIHLGGQSVGRFPVRFAIESDRNRYRYFYKHFGAPSLGNCRRVVIIHYRVRQLGYGLKCLLRPSEALKQRLKMYQLALRWNQQIDPVKFVEMGVEPQIEGA
jgi:GT2 family glycosyltransferase